MKMLLMMLCALSAVPVCAQSGPQVHEDRRVTFSFHSTDAADVSVRGQWSKQPIAMARKDDSAEWQVTTGPIPAGVWEYSFVIDGLTVIDPTNPDIKPQREPSRSILHVAAEPPNTWDFQDVPHGTVHQHEYLSKSLNRHRQLSVYTPPGYESSGQSKYPLLVLQHGSGDNQRTWVEHGKAHWIFDSLIASGKAKPMIVLMIDGHPLGKVSREDPAARDQSLAAFGNELLLDALPLVESVYRVAPGPEQRGIAGLSMGGWQAIHLGLDNLDRFAWIGSFSGAADAEKLDAVLADAAGTNAKLKLLWLACGKDDFLLSRNETLVAAFADHGIKHQWQLTEGDHSWPVWRTYLSEFAPLLFQDGP